MKIVMQTSKVPALRRKKVLDIFFTRKKGGKNLAPQERDWHFLDKQPYNFSSFSLSLRLFAPASPLEASNYFTFKTSTAAGTIIITDIVLSYAFNGCPFLYALSFCFLNILLIRIGSKPAF